MTFTNEHGDELEIDNEGDLVDGVLVKMKLKELIGIRLDDFLYKIADRAGIPLLTGHTYEIEEAYDHETLVFRVKGNVRLQMEEGA